jgi:hypothetical protein
VVAEVLAQGWQVSPLAWLLAGLIVSGPAAILAIVVFRGVGRRARAVTEKVAGFSVLALALPMLGLVITRRIGDFALLAAADGVWVAVMAVAGIVRARRLGVPFGAPAPEATHEAPSAADIHSSTGSRSGGSGRDGGRL